MDIAILVFPGMTALDALGPYEVLNLLPDINLRFVWKETGPVLTDSGVLAIGATHTLADTPRADVVLIPGSSGRTLNLMADGAILDWLRAVDKTTTWTTSVCSGACILASAGLLRGKRATTHWIAMDILERFGALPVPDQRVVQDGKFITAAGVSAGIDMALTLAGEIAGAEWAKVIQLLIEYDPQPPYDSGSVIKATPAIRTLATNELKKRAQTWAQLTPLAKLLVRDWAARGARRMPWRRQRTAI